MSNLKAEAAGLQIKEFAVQCQYCGNRAELTNGQEIYPNIPSLANHKFYICRPCDAWVGTHIDTAEPLGTLANKETRTARIMAHSFFDPLWKSGYMGRGEAYSKLRKFMRIDRRKCHIGKFNIKQCHEVVRFVKGLPDAPQPFEAKTTFAETEQEVSGE